VDRPARRAPVAGPPAHPADVPGGRGTDLARFGGGGVSRSRPGRLARTPGRARRAGSRPTGRRRRRDRVALLGEPDLVCRAPGRPSRALRLLRRGRAGDAADDQGARRHPVSVPSLWGQAGADGRSLGPCRGRRRDHGVDRDTGVRGLPPRQRALNDPQLLPVGRAPAGVANRTPRCARGGDPGVGGVHPGPAPLRRSPPGSVSMVDRQVTVYWSST
jgi:hypothetical protein